MNTVTIQCDDFDKECLYSALKDALLLPQWCANNLDALYDCLTEIFEDTRLTLVNLPTLPGVRETLEDAARDNEFLTIVFESSR